MVFEVGLCGSVANYEIVSCDSYWQNPACRSYQKAS